MANEIQAYLTTGNTLYAVLINSVGKAWNGTEFETITSGSWANYDIALTETTAGIYFATMPTTTAGEYNYIVYENTSGSPLITDTILGIGTIQWDGNSVVSRNDITTDIASTVWNNSRRTLTFSPQNLASITDGDSLSLIRGDTFIYEFTGIDMTDYEQSFFTVKENYKDNDYESLVMVSSASGVLYLDGVRKTNGLTLGSITSGSASLTVKIEASATKEIPYSTDNYFYDLQVMASGSVTTPHIGEIALIRDTTKRVS